MSSIDRQSGVGVIEQGAAVTETPDIVLGGGAFGALLVPVGWSGGLVFSWNAVYEDDAGDVVKAPIVDVDGAPITSTVVAGAACEIPPAVMGFARVRASFTVSTGAHTLRMFIKG